LTQALDSFAAAEAKHAKNRRWALTTETADLTIHKVHVAVPLEQAFDVFTTGPRRAARRDPSVGVGAS
jgi:hypothetical protein